MELPREVVEHIFSITPSGNIACSDRDEEPLLNFTDRVRAQAVCRAWRAWLRPSGPLVYSGPCELREQGLRWVGPSSRGAPLLPLDWVVAARPALSSVHCFLDGDGLWGDSNPLEALCALQPHALQRLALTMGEAGLSSFLPHAGLLSSLEDLRLISLKDAQLGFAALPASLRRLDASRFGLLEISAPAAGPLPALEELRLGPGSKLQLDAALPSLCSLAIDSVKEVRLGGPGLSLPHLTALELSMELGGAIEECSAEVDFGAMPSLASLTLRGVAALVAPGGGPPASLGSLQHLTRLTAGGQQEGPWRAAAALLQAAPPSLRELDAGHILSGDAAARAAIVGPPLADLTQLTGLQLGNNVQLLPYLSGLQRLRELTVRMCGYRIEDAHMRCLAALRGLRRLEWRGWALDTAAYCRRLETLLPVLPGGCLVVVRPRLPGAVTGAGPFQSDDDKSCAVAGQGP